MLLLLPLAMLPRRRMKRQQQPHEQAPVVGEEQQMLHLQQERRRQRLEAHASRQSELPALCCSVRLSCLPRPVQLKAPSV